jgi:hypothetical protein
MKTVLSLVMLAALVSFAQAQDKKADDSKPLAPNSPWSVDTVDKSDGYFGSSSTTVTRDIGEGWSLGGKLTTPYEEPKIGGSGAPGHKQYENPSSTTVIGPVLQKKF